MTDLTTRLGMHCTECAKTHHALADAFDEAGYPEMSALHKSLGLAHASMAECCLKAVTPEFHKADAVAPELEMFLKIEG